MLRTSEKESRPIPLELIFTIIADAADGLHAAHEAKSVTGESLDIVHRDVSPQNIHVGYDGHVKVVDFGIAAASGRITSTRTGEVKGKLAYMAPEQLHKGPMLIGAQISGRWGFCFGRRSVEPSSSKKRPMPTQCSAC